MLIWLRRLLVVIVAACIASLPLSAVAEAAPGCKHCATGQIYGTTGWSGSYSISVGGAQRDAYCIQPNRWYAQGTYRRDHTRTDDVGMRVGYLISTWHGTKDPAYATSISMLVSRHIAGSDVQWNSFPHLHGLASQLWEEAGRMAGRYVIASHDITEQPTIENGFAFSTVFRVDRHGGGLRGEIPPNWVSLTDQWNLRDVAVTREGGTAFRVSGHLDDPYAPWRVGVRVTSPSGGADIWHSDVPQAQNVATFAPGSSSAPSVVVGKPAAYQPRATTSTSAQLVSPGAELTDTIHVFDGIEGHAFVGESALFGPFSSDDEALSTDVSGLEPVGIGVFEGSYGTDGTAVVTSSPVVVDEPGYYTWVEQLHPTDYSRAFTQQRDNRPPEVTLVAAPMIASHISHDEIADDTLVTDSLSFEGIYATVGATELSWSASGGLFGPVAPGKDGTCVTATWEESEPGEFHEFSLTPTVDGIVTLEDVAEATITPTMDLQCYSWGWTLTATAADGSEIVTEHAPGHPDQTVAALRPPEPIVPTPGERIINTGENTLVPFLPGGRYALATFSLLAAAVTFVMVRFLGDRT